MRDRRRGPNPWISAYGTLAGIVLSAGTLIFSIGVLWSDVEDLQVQQSKQERQLDAVTSKIEALQVDVSAQGATLTPLSNLPSKMIEIGTQFSRDMNVMEVRIGGKVDDFREWMYERILNTRPAAERGGTQ